MQDVRAIAEAKTWKQDNKSDSENKREPKFHNPYKT